MNEWTKIEDGLPDPLKDCWVTYEFTASGFRNVIEGFINDNGRWNFMSRTKGSRAERKVIAWMYRDSKPAPYGVKKVDWSE